MLMVVVYLYGLLIMFHQILVLLNFLNHQIKHLTSIIVLPFTLYLFPFSFFLSSSSFQQHINSNLHDNFLLFFDELFIQPVHHINHHHDGRRYHLQKLKFLDRCY